MSFDEILKRIDIELLRKQYAYLLDQIAAPGNRVQDQPELYGLIELVETLIDTIEGGN